MFRSRRSTPFRGGSSLLHSCAGRVGRTLIPVALLWLLAGWALDWWQG